MDGEDMVRSYTQISQDEAKKMMEQDGTQIIVDVRTQEEYDSGHIPGAICIPNESIGTEQPDELPDLDQIILIYCRSGNRSKQAAQKLFDMGYTNIYEFGGINEWTGEVVTEASDADTSQESEPEAQVTEEEKTDMKLKIGDTEVPVTWEENESVDALEVLAAQEPLAIQMSMYGGFEQVGSIGQSIVSDDQQTTTQAGDIVLYSGDQIVVFYGSNSWAYTRLGKVTDKSKSEMTELLGKGDVTATFMIGK
jgi:rhodanese-related sulfurtransferase